MNQWYLVSMNAGLFIIHRPPSPSGTDILSHNNYSPGLVLNVTDLPKRKAQAIVEAHNSTIANLTRERDEAREKLDIMRESYAEATAPGAMMVTDAMVEAFGRQMYGISWERLSLNHERKAEVRAALEAALPLCGQGWQPIETAPPARRGLDILCGFQGQFQWVSFVATANGPSTHAPNYAPPTHWTHLPPAPKPPAGG